MEVFVSTERLHRSPRAHEGLLQRIVGKRTATPTSGSYVRELGPYGSITRRNASSSPCRTASMSCRSRGFAMRAIAPEGYAVGAAGR